MRHTTAVEVKVAQPLSLGFIADIPPEYPLCILFSQDLSVLINEIDQRETGSIVRVITVKIYLFFQFFRLPGIVTVNPSNKFTRGVGYSIIKPINHVFMGVSEERLDPGIFK